MLVEFVIKDGEFWNNSVFNGDALDLELAIKERTAKKNLLCKNHYHAYWLEVDTGTGDLSLIKNLSVMASGPAPVVLNND